MLESTRRDFLRTVLGGTAALSLPWPARAQGGSSAPPSIVATKLTGRVTVLGGDGGNVGLIIGPDGLLMIDGGYANRAADLARAIAGVDRRRVQVLFNTHYHFDHVGSNERLGNTTVRIIAHENVPKRLRIRFDDPAMGRTMEPLAEAGEPKDTFSSGGKLEFGRDSLEYTHVPMAHTDGDAFVLLPESNVLHTGDLLWFGRYPVIDYTVGGSLPRMAAALGQLDRLVDDRTRIIPGHGPASVTRADMRETHAMWVTIADRLEAHVKQGHSIDEVLAAAPTREFDAKLGVRNPEPFLRQAYGSVLPAPR